MGGCAQSHTSYRVWPGCHSCSPGPSLSPLEREKALTGPGMWTLLSSLTVCTLDPVSLLSDGLHWTALLRRGPWGDMVRARCHLGRAGLGGPDWRVVGAGRHSAREVCVGIKDSRDPTPDHILVPHGGSWDRCHWKPAALHLPSRPVMWPWVQGVHTLSMDRRGEVASWASLPSSSDKNLVRHCGQCGVT